MIGVGCGCRAITRLGTRADASTRRRSAFIERSAALVRGARVAAASHGGRIIMQIVDVVAGAVEVVRGAVCVGVGTGAS